MASKRKKPQRRLSGAAGDFGLLTYPNGLKLPEGVFPLETDFRAGLMFWDLCRNNALTAERFTDLFSPSDSRRI